MDLSYIYMIFALMAGASFLLIVPKDQYKKVLLYAMIFGGLGDVAIAGILTLLGLVRYKAMGPFNVLGIFSFWIPIAWTYTYAIFFYLLPARKLFIVPYIIAFAGLSYATGLTLQNFGLFEYIGITKYLAPLVFLSWYSVSAWAYYKNEDIPLN